MNSLGANIRAYRIKRKLRQEDLAEKTGLSVTYIGMLERDEKTPSLETFVNILNVLDASADVVLADLLKSGYTVKNSVLNEKMSKLSEKDREKIYDVIDTMIKHSNKNL